MNQGDVKAFIDEQIKQFLAFGREDLAEQVENAIALVAEGKCSADVCYKIFESAKRELRDLTQEQDLRKSKKRRTKKKPATVPSGGGGVKPKPPPSLLSKVALGDRTLEEGVPQLLEEACVELRARILYHVLRIVEQRTRPLHAREKPTTYPRKELESICYPPPSAAQQTAVDDDGNDYALGQAKTSSSVKRNRKKKAIPVSSSSTSDDAVVRVDFALLHQAIELGVKDPGERLDLILPRHLLTRFDILWMRSQRK
jgi:hypothetical protein